MPGPTPKRSEERRRRNKEGVEVQKVDIAQLAAADVEIPVADQDWHPVAHGWYESLKKSGQAIFYEPSDWMTAYVLAETLSRELDPQPMTVTEEDDDGNEHQIFKMVKLPIKGATLTALLKGMTALMITEGDRRRLKIELEREKARAAAAEGGSNVVSIVQDRQKLFV